MTVDLVGIGTVVSASFTALLALATFVLARATKNLVKEGQKQQKLVLYQASAARSQLDPLLKLHSWNFKENNLVIELENLGVGRAFWVGVNSWFDPCKLRMSAEEEGKPLTESQINELIAKKKEKVWVEATTLDTARKLNYKEHKDVKPAHMVSLLLNDRLGNDPILDAKERRTFSIEPHFVIEPRSESWRSGWRWPFGGMAFKEMREFMQTNGVPFVAIGFSVICRNSVDDNVEGESFGYYVVITHKDSTLEEVARTNLSHSLATLGEREFVKLKYIEGDLYKKGRVLKPPHEQPT